MGNCCRRSAPKAEEVEQRRSAPKAEEVEERRSAQSAAIVEVVEEQPAAAIASPLEEVIEAAEPPVPGSGPTVEEIEKPQISRSAPTKEEVIDSLNDVSNTADLNEFIFIIKKVLEERSNKGSKSESAIVKEEKASTSASAEEQKRIPSSLVTSGAKFLKFLNGHMEKMKEEEDIFNPGNSTVVAGVLKEIGHLHWAVGGLAIIAYVIEKSANVSANKDQALELLSNMVDLATTVIDLKDVISEEKLKKAVMMIVQGSIMCVSQIYSEKLFSFLKTKVNSENLKDMSEKLHHLYEDLNLVVTKKLKRRQSEIARQQSMRESEILKRQPILLNVPKPSPPKDAVLVGIEKAQEEVIKLLDMTPENESRLVVVICGFGGLGKTTLAETVVVNLNLQEYNYAHVSLDEDRSKNDLKKIQEVILHDACPSFHTGSIINLRDCREGRIHLIEAFKCPENKPIFLFIDNALRHQDLQDLLPEDLSALPKRSRIFLTTRLLNVTDLFLTSGIDRKDFPMRPLDNDYAVKMLCKDSVSRECINDDNMKRILRICGGVPLALKIVRSHLAKMKYNVDKCSGILDDLEKGNDVKEEKFTQRLVQYVYNELEQRTQDAFLDICCLFSGWARREVEYVVGEEDVESLGEAGLVTFSFIDGRGFTGFVDEERLIVHDIVKAKGRSMSASTRFMDVESFRETAQDQTKLTGVKGLWLEDVRYVLDLKHLNLMRHSLRILHLGSGIRTSAPSSLKFKFNELRYLDATDRHGQLSVKVEEADMLRWYAGPGGGPNGIRLNKLPKRLRMLRLLLSEESSTFTQNDSVEQLFLRGTRMKQLPEGLHQLRSLKILMLYGYDIEEFPEQVCELSSLVKLGVYGWYGLQRLPQSFGRLKGLTHLQISLCDELEELPSSFGELKALEYLSLQYCGKLKELPGGLDSLKYLHVRGCHKLSVELYETKQDLKIVNTME